MSANPLSPEMTGESLYKYSVLAETRVPDEERQAIVTGLYREFVQGVCDLPVAQGSNELIRHADGKDMTVGEALGDILESRRKRGVPDGMRQTSDMTSYYKLFEERVFTFKQRPDMTIKFRDFPYVAMLGKKWFIDNDNETAITVERDQLNVGQVTIHKGDDQPVLSVIFLQDINDDDDDMSIPPQPDSIVMSKNGGSWFDANFYGIVAGLKFFKELAFDDELSEGAKLHDAHTRLYKPLRRQMMGKLAISLEQVLQLRQQESTT